MLVKGNHCGHFKLFVILWYLGNLKFLWGYSIIWFQRKFYLCYFIIKISTDSMSFFPLSKHDIFDVLFYSSHVRISRSLWQPGLSTWGFTFHGGFYFKLRPLQRLSTIIFWEEDIYCYENLWQIFSQVEVVFSERWSLNSNGIQCSLEAINVFRVRRYVINILILR